MTLVVFPAGARRYNGAARRFLSEGARTNLCPNPGNTYTSATALPTGWTVGTAVTRTFTIGKMNGVPGVFIRFTGTPSGTGAQGVTPPATDTGTTGSTATWSLYVALVAGSIPSNVSPFTFRNSGETNVVTTVVPTATLQRFTMTKAMTTTTVGPTLRYNFTDTTTAVDFTLFVGGCQVEMAAFVSSLILPADGTSAASSRAADVLSLALPADRRAQGTLLGTFLIPSQSNVAQGLFQLDDGTDTNRVLVQVDTGTTKVSVRPYSGGTAGGNTGVTLAAAALFGAPVRIALGWDGASLSFVVNGTLVTLANALPAVTRLLIGHGTTALNRPLFGEVGPLEFRPSRLADADLKALAA